LQLSGGWTDAGFDKIGNAAGITTKTPFQRTPEYSYPVGAVYNQPLDSGAVVDMNLNYGWKDDQTNNTTDTNNVWLPSYGLLNGRLSYTAPTGQWTITAYGKNLLDEDYLVSAFDPSTRGNFMGFVQHDRGRPREYGVEVAVNF
jgi:iron complex outermembrane receptor protein